MFDKNEIIEMAEQAGKEWAKEYPTPEETAHQVPRRFLEIFAKLVAAKEREIVAVFLEKECKEQYLADRVRSREFNGAEKWIK